jgi:hypothetical protein
MTSKTSIMRGAQPLASKELKVGETIFILSMDGGVTAFSVMNFGVLPAIP